MTMCKSIVGDRAEVLSQLPANISDGLVVHMTTPKMTPHVAFTNEQYWVGGGAFCMHLTVKYIMVEFMYALYKYYITQITQLLFFN